MAFGTANSKRSVEKIEKMSLFIHEKITDAERMKKKGVISPDLNKMKIMAINLKMRSVTYFRSEAQYQRWAKSVENLNDYKIKINGKIVKQPN